MISTGHPPLYRAPFFHTSWARLFSSYDGFPARMRDARRADPGPPCSPYFSRVVELALSLAIGARPRPTHLQGHKWHPSTDGPPLGYPMWRGFVPDLHPFVPNALSNIRTGAGKPPVPSSAALILVSVSVSMWSFTSPRLTFHLHLVLRYRFRPIESAGSAMSLIL